MNISILQHALGLRNPGAGGRMYRNHFVTGPGSKDFDDCMELVTNGFMTKHDNTGLVGEKESIFTVTQAGIDYVRKNKQPTQEYPDPLVLTRSQKRYRHYRRCLDVGYDGSFGQWLKDKKYKEYDAQA